MHEIVATSMATAVDTDGGVPHWQAVFDGNEALFAELSDGARMGLIAQPGFAPTGRRLAGLDAAAAKHAGMPMLAFEVMAGRVLVTLRPFAGFEGTGLDLLFVADEDARAELAAAPADATLRAMKRLIRRGNVMFFVFRTRHELQDAGYDDFLDSLGLAFLGACR
jgi:hypothetical protein